MKTIALHHVNGKKFIQFNTPNDLFSIATCNSMDFSSQMCGYKANLTRQKQHKLLSNDLPLKRSSTVDFHTCGKVKHIVRLFNGKLITCCLLLLEFRRQRRALLLELPSD